MRKIEFTSGNGDWIELGNETYTIEKLEGMGVPRTSIAKQKAPYQDGYSFIDVLLESRTIVIQGAYGTTLKNMSQIYTARRAIAKTFNPKAGMGTILYTDDIQGKLIYGVPTEPNMPDKPYGNYWKFMISIECFDPYWKDISETSKRMSLITPAWEFPFSLDTVTGFQFSTLATTNNIVINNWGDWIAPVKLKFYGPALNPKIENKTTGQFIKLNTSILLNEYVELSTQFGNKYADLHKADGSIVDAMASLDLTSTFWGLALGNNTLGFTTDDASQIAYCDVLYRLQYVGV